MILAIDVGNTNIVVGCIQNEKIMFFERIATDTLKTELEYAATLNVLFELYHIEKKNVTGCIISSTDQPYSADGNSQAFWSGMYDCGTRS